jgi:clan AA aspartic protease (TIGR02281 family)
MPQLFLVLLLVTPMQDKTYSEALKAKGYKVATANVVASEEAEVDKGLKSLKTVYNAVIDAKQRLANVERDVEANKQAITTLMARRVQLGQLMNNQSSTANRNAVVVQYNAVTDELNLRIERDQKGDTLAKARELYASPRNTYLKSVLALRELIDKTDAKYKKDTDDSALAGLIAAANKAENRKLTLGPSKEYQANVKAFVRYEALILSDSITLERESNTYTIDVSLNGKDPVKMVFDTGASMISLSHAMAVKAGLKPDEAKTEAKVTIANGETVKVKRIKIASVRVGKFEVKNVECVVMPEELADSPALLGGSFLNNFKYEIDSDAKKVRLTRLEGVNTKPAGK